MRWTPASASASAIATLSSVVQSDARLLSPSRSVTSCNSNLAGSDVPARASGA